MKRGSKLMSFPQLRSAFEKVNQAAKKLLQGAHPAKVTGRFQEIWRQTFGKALSPKAALAYLSMTKKGQHGGSLSPAPASWDDGQLRPGAAFPPILNPQGVMTQSYQPMPGYPGANVPSPSFPSAASCGAMKGGRRSRGRTRRQRGGAQIIPTPAAFASSFAAHPYVSQNPNGVIGDMSRIFNGQAVAAAMDATKVVPPYLSYTAGNMSLIPMSKFDGSSWISTSGAK